MTVRAGETSEQTMEATDADGNPLSFLKASGPGFMSVTTESSGPPRAVGRILLTPGSLEAGFSRATVKVTDGALTDSTRLAISVLSTTPPEGAELPLFQAGFLSVDVGNDPQAVVAGDWNADGHVDLAVANTGSCTISILLGNGTGRFHPRSDMAAGPRSRSLVAGDVNGDAKLDLVVADSSWNSVTPLVGDGSGGFTPLPPIATAAGPCAAALGDLNGDLKLDLVLANEAADSVSIHLGIGDGSFLARSTRATGKSPRALAIIDLNMDGMLDLVVANSGSASLSTYLGDGAGTFGTRMDASTAANPVAFAIADITKDGALDAVVLGFESGEVDRLVGDGAGSFVSTNCCLFVFQPAAIVAEDLDLDGITDFAVAEQGNSVLSIFYGLDLFSFDPPIWIGSSNSPHGLAVADFDANGWPDLIAASGGYYSPNAGTSLAVHLGTGDRSFGETRLESGPTSVRGTSSVLLEDLNGDGKIDVALANRLANSVGVFRGNGDRTFGARLDWYVGGSSSDLAAADLNRDGRVDLAVTKEFSKTVSVALGDGSGGFTFAGEFPIPGIPLSVAIGELNGDGVPDLVTTSQGSSNAAVLLGIGNGTFGPAVPVGPISFHNDAALADVNQDSMEDIIMGSGVFLGNGDGTFGAKIPYPVTGGSSAAIADFDNDGLEDVAVVVLGGVTVMKGNGDGTFGSPRNYGAGLTPTKLGVADLNGDGTEDLAVANLFSNTLSVLLGHGDGTFETKSDYGSWWVPYALATGDLDQDGRPEVAVANYTSGSGAILWNRGLGSVLPMPVAIDFDPDVVNLKSHAPWLTAYIEPSGFDPTSIDISTLRLAGAVPAASKLALMGDHDGNGVPELMVKFSRDVLDPLLTLGANELEITGSLVTGEDFMGSDEVRVIDPPGAPLSASVAPNPLNPSGVITFNTARPGRVKVTIFDLQGRFVRTLMETHLPAGQHEVTIDGRGNRGEVLSSAVYFYVLDSPDGIVKGRFAVLK